MGKMCKFKLFVFWKASREPPSVSCDPPGIPTPTLGTTDQALRTTFQTEGLWMLTQNGVEGHYSQNALETLEKKPTN